MEIIDIKNGISAPPEFLGGVYTFFANDGRHFAYRPHPYDTAEILEKSGSKYYLKLEDRGFDAALQEGH